MQMHLLLTSTVISLLCIANKLLNFCYSASIPLSAFDWMAFNFELNAIICFQWLFFKRFFSLLIAANYNYIFYNYFDAMQITPLFLQTLYGKSSLCNIHWNLWTKLIKWRQSNGVAETFFLYFLVITWLRKYRLYRSMVKCD